MPRLEGHPGPWGRGDVREQATRHCFALQFAAGLPTPPITASPHAELSASPGVAGACNNPCMAHESADRFRDGAASRRVADLALLDLRCGTGMWRPRRAHRAASDLAEDLRINDVYAITSPQRAGEWADAFGAQQVLAPSETGRLPAQAVVVVDLTGLRGQVTVGLDTALAGRSVITSSSLGSRTHGLPMPPVAAAASDHR